MADAYSCRPQSSDSDGPARPPTFVQIHPPATGIGVGRKLGIAGVGVALAMAVGWAAWDAPREPASMDVTEAAPAATDAASPPPAAHADLRGDLARYEVDRAAFAPVWSRESLMGRLLPFDLSVPPRAPSVASPVDAANATSAQSSEITVQLGKGDTIGSALQRLGFPADAISDVVTVLTPHVRLKRLPVGLDMTVEIGPAARDDAKPVLQALTLHPEGRRDIKVERDSDGNYVMERPSRR